MYLKWHATASIELGNPEGRILFDPFFPFKGAEFPVSPETYDGFPVIFVTHGHFDHIRNIPALIRRNPETIVYATETPLATLKKKGVPEKNLRLLSFGDSVETNGFTVTAYHGCHAILPGVSARRIRYALRSPVFRNLFPILRDSLVCKENDECVFYTAEAEGKTVALMGSLNVREDVEYPTGADLLVLPYNGWEDNCPVACGIIERLRPKRCVLDHYDDAFPPLTMPLDLSPILERYPGLVSALAFQEEIEI
ncbi:MAG: MBL fold metallo-hydrolase [Oscillospiraceae bacterium]|nr:MBL fold metallo-hydrolase [Oscillospiraceae bacterium]